MFAERVPDLPDVPTELTALLRRGMANDPAARPTAAELRDELAGFHRDPDPTMVMRDSGPERRIPSRPSRSPSSPADHRAAAGGRGRASTRTRRSARTDLPAEQVVDPDGQ